MKLPGVNYNWQVTPFQKQDPNLPVGVAKAKAAIAGSIAGIAGTVEEGAQFVETRKQEEFVRLKGMMDDLHEAEAAKVVEEEEAGLLRADIELAEGVAAHGLASVSAPYTSAQAQPEGSEYGSQETKSEVDGFDVVDKPNDNIPSILARPESTFEFTKAQIEASSKEILPGAVRDAFVQDSTHKATLKFIADKVASVEAYKKFRIAESEDLIKANNEKGKFGVNAAIINRFPGSSIRKRELARENKTKHEEWIDDSVESGDEGVINYDKVRLRLNQLSDEEEYYKTWGGLDNQKRLVQIKKYRKMLDDRKAELEAAGEYNTTLGDFRTNNVITLLNKGEDVSTKDVNDAFRHVVRSQDVVLETKLSTAIANQSEYSIDAYLPPSVRQQKAQERAEVAGTKGTPYEAIQADKFLKVTNKDNELATTNMPEWLEKHRAGGLPPIDYTNDEARSSSLKARYNILGENYVRNGVFNAMLTRTEQEVEATRFKGMSPESQITESKFLVSALGVKGAEAYLYQFMHTDETEIFPVIIDLVADGKEALATKAAIGYRARKENPDLGQNFIAEASKYYSSEIGNAFGNDVVARGKIFNTALNATISENMGEKVKFNKTSFLNNVRALTDEKIIKLDSNYFIFKPSKEVMSQDVETWVGSKGISDLEIERLMSSQNLLELNVDTQTLVDGIHDNVYQLHGPYEGGYVVRHKETGEIVNDWRTRKPLVLHYSDEYINVEQSNRLKLQKDLKGMTPEARQHYINAQVGTHAPPIGKKIPADELKKLRSR